MVCSLCGHYARVALYAPIGTKRGAQVCRCLGCNLIFTETADIPYSREPNPSGDADWGNIRWCKTQQLAAIHDWIPTDAKRVLDVGSSRGDFADYFASKNPRASITTIEPDTRIIDGYKDRYDMRPCYIEQTVLDPVYDFIYCSHTLEHANSAPDMLMRIRGAMAPNGLVLIEVPNVEVTQHPQSIWEFFIDKHNYHFSHKILRAYMEWMGFRIERINDDMWNVRILASKCEPVAGPLKFIDDDHTAMICQYAETVMRNRSKLPGIVKKMRRVMTRMKSAFWGASTILDLLFKYGGLYPSEVECLVDTYMHDKLPLHSGIPVRHPDYLRVHRPDVCFILSRLSSPVMEALARGYGVRQVITFSSLMESEAARG